jgi:hypothetical protein
VGPSEKLGALDPDLEHKVEIEEENDKVNGSNPSLGLKLHRLHKVKTSCSSTAQQLCYQTSSSLTFFTSQIFSFHTARSHINHKYHVVC